MATNTITRLAQAQLTASAANLVTATSANTVVKLINIVNMSGVSQTVELFIGTTGTSSVTNQVYKATLSDGDSAAFDGLMVVPTTLFLTGRTTSVAGSGVTITIHGMNMT